MRLLAEGNPNGIACWHCRPLLKAIPPMSLWGRAERLIHMRSPRGRAQGSGEWAHNPKRGSPDVGRAWLALGPCSSEFGQISARALPYWKYVGPGSANFERLRPKLYRCRPPQARSCTKSSAMSTRCGPLWDKLGPSALNFINKDQGLAADNGATAMARPPNRGNLPSEGAVWRFGALRLVTSCGALV